MLSRNIGIVLKILVTPFILSVKGEAYSSLETVHNNLVRFLSKRNGYFTLSIVVEPLKLSIVVLILIEQGISSLAFFHGSRDGNSMGVISRPGSISQYLDTEFYATDLFTLVLSESNLEFLAKLNVSKHFTDLVHSLNSTFNFQLLEHLLLGFLRKCSFIKETTSQ